MPRTVSSPGLKSHGFYGRRGFQEAQLEVFVMSGHVDTAKTAPSWNRVGGAPGTKFLRLGPCFCSCAEVSTTKVAIEI